jgi:type I restriction enzyme M protein
MKQEGENKSHLFTSEQKSARCTDYVTNKVFAIDFDEKAVRVGRTLNLIAGDGQTNVLHFNTLDFERWDEKTKDENWLDIYGEGWKKLRKLRTHKDENRDFNFDILMANPPFAGDIKETRILAKYELGKKDNGKYQTSVGRDILFIERNLSFLKAGGRMAVVLPQGRFNNSSDKQIREYIAEHCRILAVVGLHGNVFKPHTGTKTSVLLVQKWDDVLCPKVDDYPIFFATMQEFSKDNSGDKIYVTQADGSPLLDTHEHLIVKHDLFNHDGLTQDGIAEAFIEFAKKENLSFFDCDLSGFKNLKGLYAEPFNEVKYRALLGRLEAVEINISECKSIIDFRIDSNTYKKDFLLTETLLSKKNALTIDSISLSVQNFGAYSLCNLIKFTETGLPFLMAQNIRENYIDWNIDKYIDLPSHEMLFKSHCRKNQVLITMAGYLGRVAVYSKDEVISSNQAIAKITLKNEKDAYLVATFLNSKHGQNQIHRLETATAQPNINMSLIKVLKIPPFKEDFSQQIENVVLSSEERQRQSKSIYTQAENLLLNTLGMADFSPSTEKVNIKSFKDSFIATGRLDAEYYQPKYDELEEKIAETHELVKLNTFLTVNQRGTQPNYAEQGLPVINSKHVREGEVLLTDNRFAALSDKEEPLFIKKGDVLINGTGVGTIGRAACYLHEQDAIPDNHVTILRTNKINPIYLSVYLNSIAGKYQVDKYFKGSSGQIELYPKDIDDFYIPLINEDTQNKIADLVQQSFILKAQSEQLLATAKHAVELAIETNEQTALQWIDTQIRAEI